MKLQNFLYSRKDCKAISGTYSNTAALKSFWENGFFKLISFKSVQSACEAFHLIVNENSLKRKRLTNYNNNILQEITNSSIRTYLRVISINCRPTRLINPFHWKRKCKIGSLLWIMILGTQNMLYELLFCRFPPWYYSSKNEKKLAKSMSIIFKWYMS